MMKRFESPTLSELFETTGGGPEAEPHFNPVQTKIEGFLSDLVVKLSPPVDQLGLQPDYHRLVRLLLSDVTPTSDDVFEILDLPNMYRGNTDVQEALDDIVVKILVAQAAMDLIDTTNLNMEAFAGDIREAVMSDKARSPFESSSSRAEEEKKEEEEVEEKEKPRMSLTELEKSRLNRFVNIGNIFQASKVLLNNLSTVEDIAEAVRPILAPHLSASQWGPEELASSGNKGDVIFRAVDQAEKEGKLDELFKALLKMAQIEV
jgi:hypothetical protein